MSGNLNMGDHRIKNVKNPQADQDAATKKYVNSSHVTSSDKSDVFRYVMEHPEHLYKIW